MTEQLLQKVFAYRVRQFCRTHGAWMPHGLRLVISRSHFLPHPALRDLAWYTPATATVHVLRRAFREHDEVILALIDHELGHAAAQGRESRQAERQADLLAEAATGWTIRYDSRNIQTLGQGRSPRPRELHQ